MFQRSSLLHSSQRRLQPVVASQRQLAEVEHLGEEGERLCASRCGREGMDRGVIGAVADGETASSSSEGGLGLEEDVEEAGSCAEGGEDDVAVQQLAR